MLIRKKSLNLLILMIIVNFTSFTVVSRANDSKSVPGAVCRPEHHYDIAGIYYADGRIAYYGSSDTINVICPLYRDSTSEDLHRLWVQTRKYYSDDIIVCSIIGRSPSGGAVSTSMPSQTWNDGSEGVNFIYLENYLNFSQNQMMYLRCSLPKSNSIWYITYEEWS